MWVGVNGQAVNKIGAGAAPAGAIRRRRRVYLQVSPGGGKSWLFRYKIGGRARAMGLGPVRLVTLAQARERAQEARRTLLAGIDPIAARLTERNTARLQAVKDVTFEQCAEQMLASHEAAWRNLKHRAQWSARLRRMPFRFSADLPIRDINTALVLKVLLPLWSTKPETASRLRQRIERVLRWAKSIGYRDGDNPAAWDILRELLPEPGQCAQRAAPSGNADRRSARVHG